jgi:hypothetical protein
MDKDLIDKIPLYVRGFYQQMSKNLYESKLK